MSISYHLNHLYQTRRFDVAMLMAAALFPVYRTFVSVVMLGLVGVAVFGLYLYHRSTRRLNITRVTWIHLAITVGYYVILILSLLYSSNASEGAKFVLSNSYLLIYPLIVLPFMEAISSRHLRLIHGSFVAGCVLLCMYIHYLFFRAGLYLHFRRAEYNDLPFRTVLMDNEYHPTYVSMWLLYGSLFLILFLYQEKDISTSKRLGIVFVIGFFVITTTLLSAKIAIIAFVCGICILIFRMIANKVILALALAGLILAVFILVLNVSFLKSRFIDEFNSTELKPPIGLHTNSLNIRVGIYECSWKLFNENWLAGVGVGDTQPMLNSCYDSFDTEVYKESSYNTHNYYFFMGVSTGTVGLALFLLMQLFHLVKSIKLDNTLFIIFVVFVGVCLLAENILSRHHGVVFYSLFCSVLAKLNLQKHQPS